jgi:basic amino acid/polyamine antiporter, APA family
MATGASGMRSSESTAPRGCWRELARSICRHKGLDWASEEEHKTGPKLARELGVLGLTLIGVGEIIGTGILVLTGTVAANNAGPAVILSFLIAAFSAALAALCYAELVTLIPVAGSSYAFAYVSLGELLAWMVG